MGVTTVYFRNPRDETGMVQWARDNCPSFVTFEGVEVGEDFPGGDIKWNMLFEFHFTDVKDAEWFTLRWA